MQHSQWYEYIDQWEEKIRVQKQTHTYTLSQLMQRLENDGFFCKWYWGNWLSIYEKLKFNLSHCREKYQFWVLNIKDKAIQFLEGTTEEYFFCDFEKRLATRKKVIL